MANIAIQKADKGSLIVILDKAENKNTLASRNAGDEKNLHLGGRKITFLTNLTELFKIKFTNTLISLFLL